MGNPRWKWKLSLACSTFGSSYILYIYWHRNQWSNFIGRYFEYSSVIEIMKSSSNGFVKSESQDCQISAGATKSLLPGFAPGHQGREGSLRQLCNFQTIVSLLIVEESGNSIETIGSDQVTFAAFAFH